MARDPKQLVIIGHGAAGLAAAVSAAEQAARLKLAKSFIIANSHQQLWHRFGEDHERLPDHRR